MSNVTIPMVIVAIALTISQFVLAHRKGKRVNEWILIVNLIRGLGIVSGSFIAISAMWDGFPYAVEVTKQHLIIAGVAVVIVSAKGAFKDAIKADPKEALKHLTEEGKISAEDAMKLMNDIE